MLTTWLVFIFIYFAYWPWATKYFCYNRSVIMLSTFLFIFVLFSSLFASNSKRDIYARFCNPLRWRCTLAMMNDADAWTELTHATPHIPSISCQLWRAASGCTWRKIWWLSGFSDFQISINPEITLKMEIVYLEMSAAKNRQRSAYTQRKL